MSVSRIKVVHPPKVVNFEDQEFLSTGILKYGAKVVETILYPDDILSLQSARGIYSLSFVKPLFPYVSEITAIRTIQLVVNLTSVAYQCAFASWFLYLLTTSSGLKKLYECIFENPFYGILWYMSFYLTAIKGSSDEAKFDKVASFLGIPKHGEFTYGQQLFESLAEKIREKGSDMIGMHPEGYSQLIGSVMGMLPGLMSQVTLKVGDAVGNLFNEKVITKVMKKAFKGVKTQLKPKTAAVYIAARNKIDFDNRQIQDQLRFIKDKANLKKIVKSSVRNPKDKRSKKAVLRAISELKTPEGGKVCLDDCKVRVRTHGGGYCEGKCSTSTMWNDKHWCWVDPSKMKHGSTRDTFLGRSYDTCDPKKASAEPVCFTGVQYEGCSVKK